MPKQRSVILSEELGRYVDAAVADGRFGSDSEVVEAGLKLLEEWERRREDLRKALQNGLDSGEPRELDFEELFEDGAFDIVTGERLSA